ncbi:MAG: hypothetical protein AMXMBFR64_56230 [Myxococcales bacterium]
MKIRIAWAFALTLGACQAPGDPSNLAADAAETPAPTDRVGLTDRMDLAKPADPMDLLDPADSVTPASLANLLAPATPARVPADPEGYASEGGYALDRKGAVHSLAVHGSRDVIDGVLADADGRRSLEWRTADGDTLPVAPPAWNLPAVAAVNASGEGLVCWNRLTGRGDGMPHPTEGVALLCRTRSGDTLGPEVALPSSSATAWLQAVVARPDGSFRVLAWHDDGWLGGPVREGHGRWEHVVRDGALDSPRLIAAAMEGGPVAPR